MQTCSRSITGTCEPHTRQNARKMPGDDSYREDEVEILNEAILFAKKRYAEAQRRVAEREEREDAVDAVDKLQLELELGELREGGGRAEALSLDEDQRLVLGIDEVARRRQHEVRALMARLQAARGIRPLQEGGEVARRERVAGADGLDHLGGDRGHERAVVGARRPAPSGGKGAQASVRGGPPVSAFGSARAGTGDCW